MLESMKKLQFQHKANLFARVFLLIPDDGFLLKYSKFRKFSLGQVVLTELNLFCTCIHQGNVNYLPHI